MTMFHVQKGEGKINMIAVNPQHVVTIETPYVAPGSKVPFYNTVIKLWGGRELCVIEPLDVVMSLNGKAGVDKFTNAGYYYAVKDPHIEDEWHVRREDYPE